MSSCFIHPSDFNATKLSSALSSMFNMPAQQLLCRTERAVDYISPPTFTDPYPISEIDLGSCDAKPRESYFITFSTKTARLQAELKDRLDNYRNIWDELVRKREEEANAFAGGSKKFVTRAKMFNTPYLSEMQNTSTPVFTFEENEEMDSFEKSHKNHRNISNSINEKMYNASKSPSNSIDAQTPGKVSNAVKTAAQQSPPKPPKVSHSGEKSLSELSFISKIAKLNQVNYGGSSKPTGARRARVSISTLDESVAGEESLRSSMMSIADEGGLQQQVVRPPTQVTRCGRRKGAARPPSRATQPL